MDFRRLPPLRMELLEAHWSYMDGFAQEMIARGPTIAGDDEYPTGSIHILPLPDAAAARTFAFEETGYQAGVYRDVMLRRWRNDVGALLPDDGYAEIDVHQWRFGGRS